MQANCNTGDRTHAASLTGLSATDYQPNAERSTGWVCDWVRIFATPGTVAGHEPYLQGRQLPRQRPDSLEEDREW